MFRVVVVDDDPDILRLAERRLAADGHEVILAHDGEEGLNAVLLHRPQVVVMDLMMPKLHGFALCQEIRKRRELDAVQILVTSAKSYAADMNKARELGANGYLVKPYNLNELASTVMSLASVSGPPLRVKFWGTRGSIPTPGPATARYGGNTSCVEVRCGDIILMFDCGSGAREMGMALAREFSGKPLDIHLFISHTHWDHIQGFPFFLPAYTPGNRITVYSLRGSDKSLEKVFTGQMDANYFPVALGELAAKLTFIELDSTVCVGPLRISHIYLNHPGVAIGFRVDGAGKSVVYLSDHEAYCRMNGKNPHNRKLDEQIDEFVQGADLYIREAQYTEGEYEFKRSWGHSIWKDAIESAGQAGAKTVAIYHHDPMRDDEALDRILAECQAYLQQQQMPLKCIMASDNMQIDL